MFSLLFTKNHYQYQLTYFSFSKNSKTQILIGEGKGLKSEKNEYALKKKE